MSVHPRLRLIMTALGIIPGLVGIVGGIALIWGSQDAMLVMIHWVGEERALGSQSVIPQPGGGKLLTNPGAMVRWMALAWMVGASHVLTGGYVLRVGIRAILALPKRNR